MGEPFLWYLRTEWQGFLEKRNYLIWECVVLFIILDSSLIFQILISDFSPHNYFSHWESEINVTEHSTSQISQVKEHLERASIKEFLGTDSKESDSHSMRKQVVKMASTVPWNPYISEG